MIITNFSFLPPPQTTFCAQKKWKLHLKYIYDISEGHLLFFHDSHYTNLCMCRATTERCVTRQ